MFRDESLWQLIKNWWKYKPEDELYHKLEENPYYPFKMIADGYFIVVVRSDRAAYGFWFLICTFIGYILSAILLGYYALPLSFFILFVLLCLWTLKGRIAWRELLISRRGRGSYMLRVQSNQEILYEHELRNVYIRLTRKDDSSGDPYFWLNLSGYELDDYRITRMTKAEFALRVMGMSLAYRLGVNFFDWRDESEEHFIFHYKTYTTLRFVVEQRNSALSDEDRESEKLLVETQTTIRKKTFLSVPRRRGIPLRDESERNTISRSASMDSQLSSKKLVGLNQHR